MTLSGKSRLALCDDRKGSNIEIINDAPGNIVILPATNFSFKNGKSFRPFHFVDNVTEGRLSIGFRQNSKAINSILTI